MRSLADRLKKLEWELGLPAASAPFAVDTKAICRRVEAILSTQERERKCYMKYKVRLAAALVAAALALTGTALAAGPTIGEMLQTALGAFAPYAQELEGEVIREGFRVRALSALADSTAMTVYLELTDLEGDRLKGVDQFDTYCGFNFDFEGEYTSSWSFEILSYDPETRTALLVAERYMGVKIEAPVSGFVEVPYIQPGSHWVGGSEKIPLDGLTTEAVPSLTLPTGETVLAPGESIVGGTGTEREIPGVAGVTLSAVGFAADGRFHILFRFPQGTLRSDLSAVPCAQPEEGRRNPFWGATKGESGRSEHPQDGGYDMDKVFFTQGGVSYYDISYVQRPGGPEVPEYLDPIYGRYMTEEVVDGPWEIPVTVQPVEGVVSSLEGMIDHSVLKELELSPMAVHLTSRSENYTQITGYPLAVILRNGTILHSRRAESSYLEDGSVIGCWRFDTPVEVNDITGVALGAWMIPVENGVAGEGYWLSAAPE